MGALRELGQAVHKRRTQMGLTQASLAALAGLSRQTISQLESGSIGDLSLQRAQGLADVLGLALQVGRVDAPLSPTKSRLTPLDKASRTAAVSYRGQITPARLRRVLTRGQLLPADAPYVHALLDDAPMSLLAALAEQLGGVGDGSAAIWQSYRSLARQVKSKRAVWR
jgi:transcriptional regulator with XRE-family HTH domain